MAQGALIAFGLLCIAQFAALWLIGTTLGTAAIDDDTSAAVLRSLQRIGRVTLPTLLICGALTVGVALWCVLSGARSGRVARRPVRDRLLSVSPPLWCVALATVALAVLVARWSDPTTIDVARTLTRRMLLVIGVLATSGLLAPMGLANATDESDVYATNPVRSHLR